MSDIVERLGNLIECELDPAQCELYATAKAEIERLRMAVHMVEDMVNTMQAEIERLRADIQLSNQCFESLQAVSFKRAIEIERLHAELDAYQKTIDLLKNLWGVSE